MKTQESNNTFLEPVPIKASSNLITLGGQPPKVDCRVISEDNYQMLKAAYYSNQEALEALQMVKKLLDDQDKQYYLKIDLICTEIEFLQRVMHVGFMDNMTEMHYGTLTENLHTNIVEISDFINRHEMNAEQSAKTLFDIMLRRDFFNCLIGK